MDRRKKVLILYASAGHGHQKAAYAVLEACLKRPAHLEARVLDVLSLLPRPLSVFYQQVYYLQIRHTPWMWGFFYYSIDIPWIYAGVRKLRRLFNGLVARRLEKLLLDERPEVIVSTHFMATEVAAFLKRHGRIDSRLITVVTDYLPHYVWTAPEVDLYVAAMEDTKAELQKRGAPAERIQVLGIPIEHKFYEPSSKRELCKRWGLKEDRLTVLVTSGGIGVGQMTEVVEKLAALPQPIQILAVCGTNAAAVARLEKLAKEDTDLRVFGFVNNMEELMEVSDVVIGKAGGLTMTESLAKGKPVILFQSVPGQEARNAFILCKYGAGLLTDTPKKVAEIVGEFLKSPMNLQQMKEAARGLAKPPAAPAIAQLSSSKPLMGTEDLRGQLSQFLKIERAFGVEDPAARGPAGLEEKRRLLQALEEEYKDCRLCGLCDSRTHIVFGTGNPGAELMFIGEAPGFDEDKQGLPFVGAAGQLLTKIIEAMKFSREEVYIANCLKCRPPQNRPPLPTEIATCKPILLAQIEIIAPKVICALGKFAAQTLLGTEEPIGRLRGRFVERYGAKLMPTFHPAYLLRNPADKKLVWQDAQQIMKELGRS